MRWLSSRDILWGALNEVTVKGAKSVNPWVGAFTLTGALLADDVSGIGVANDLLIPAVLTGAAVHDLTQRTYVTYTLSGPEGKTYIGRASGFGDPHSIMMNRYRAHHMRLFGYGNPQLDQKAFGYPSGYNAIRGREQMLIDAHGRINSPLVGNRINAIWEYNPFRTVYMDAAIKQFGPVIR